MVGHYRKRKYFKGFDALRGIAALLVILGHVELIKSALGYQNLFNGGGPFFLYTGSLAVSCFFVLSGFLITYLLLIEKHNYGKIDVKNFYMRRILRIWPVYYIVFILGFIILPFIYSYLLVSPKPTSSSGYWGSFTFNLLLLPNFIKPSNPMGFQSWSIGVEEQFYILWPLLFVYIKSIKRLGISMFLIIILIFMMRALIILPKYINIEPDFFTKINAFFGENRFDNMAIGGLAGIYFFLKPWVKFQLWVKLIVIVRIFYILVFNTQVGFGLDNVVAALSFAMLILVVSYSERLYFLEHSVFKFLGKISYRLYMYHVVAIVIVLNLMKIFFPDFNGSGSLNILLHIIAVILTILIAMFSYTYMEKYFLKFKK